MYSIIICTAIIQYIIMFNKASLNIKKMLTLQTIVDSSNHYVTTAMLAYLVHMYCLPPTCFAFCLPLTCFAFDQDLQRLKDEYIRNQKQLLLATITECLKKEVLNRCSK